MERVMRHFYLRRRSAKRQSGKKQKRQSSSNNYLHDLPQQANVLCGSSSDVGKLRHCRRQI
jgi:hypothetical protein